MPSYTITSPEGAARYGAEEGETIDLTLTDEEATAVIAAGWITPVTTKKEK